jgi:hypothetical protein
VAAQHSEQRYVALDIVGSLFLIRGSTANITNVSAAA